MDKVDLKKLIANSDYEDNTNNIRKLKHSNLMRQDITKMLQLKSKHVRLIRNDFDRFTQLCSTQCKFLFTHYTDIFNRLLKDELDLTILGSVIDILSKIEDGSLDQMQGSVEVGELLKKLYIDSALKHGENVRNARPDSDDKEHVFQDSKTISWKEYKIMKS
jgi:hypothetical protein